MISRILTLLLSIIVMFQLYYSIKDREKIDVLDSQLFNCQLKLKSNKIRLNKTDILNQIFQITESTDRAILVMAIIKAESNFQVDAVSEKGALGLMQLLPSTAYQEFDRLGNRQVEDLNKSLVEDPVLNITLGNNYITYLQGRHKDVTSVTKRRLLVLASYNAGIHTVKRAFGCNGYKCYIKRANLSNREQFGEALDSLPDETVSYIQKTEYYYQTFRSVL